MESEDKDYLPDYLFFENIIQYLSKKKDYTNSYVSKDIFEGILNKMYSKIELIFYLIFLKAVYQNRINDVKNFIQDVNKKFINKKFMNEEFPGRYMDSEGWFISESLLVFCFGGTPLMLGKYFLDK